MRTTHPAWVSLSVLVIAFASSVFGAQDNTDPTVKEKPKERPFKYDAWCAFSDLMVEKAYVSPNAPIDPETEHVRVGVDKLGGFGRRSQWAHVVVDLKNTTDPKDKIIYQGNSTIELNHFNPDDFNQITYRTSYRQAFQVAPQTEKPYHFSIFCPENGWNHSLNVEIVTSNGRPYNRDFRLYDLDEKNEQLIVVVSDQPGSFRYLGPRAKNRDEFELPTAQNETEMGRQIASVTPSELPSRWHDLTLASLIIIDGPPLGGLSPAQWDAIKSYVKSGGKVLIMAGKDPSRLKGPVEELAGITVRASTELPSLDQFDTHFPPTAGTSKDLRVPVVEVTAASAGIVRRNSATQVVEYTAKSYGTGMVAFIPFSLSDRMFEGWPERFTIPMNLIKSEKNLFAVDLENDTETDTTQQFPQQTKRAHNQAALNALRNTLDSSFESNTPVRLHPPVTVMWFMIIYLACAVLLNYVIFTLIRKREAAWLAVPVWALGFALAAYYFGYSGRTAAIIVNEVSIVEVGAGQDTGIGRTFMGVYAPRRNDYQIEFPPLQITRDETFETEAAPSHLVNAETVKTRRDFDYPSMRLRESGDGMKIEEILIQDSATRRFEIQHRTWLGGGVDIKFINASGESETHPRVLIRNNVLGIVQKVKLTERQTLSGIILPKNEAIPASEVPKLRKYIEAGTVVYKDDRRFVVSTEIGRIDIASANVASIQTTQAGRLLHAPVFVKNGQYIEFDSGTGSKDLAEGQTWDTQTSLKDWKPIDDQFLARFAARFRDAGLDNKHVADRAGAVGNYVRNHLKQYVAGVFIAWTDGAALPVEIGPTGYKVQEPYLDGITLLVVPASANNRTRASYRMEEPKAFYATAFSPEVIMSGEWKPCGRESIPIRTPVDDKNKCVYLRLKFDRDFGQYVYKGKAAQVSFSLVSKAAPNTPPFHGDVTLSTRLDGARTPLERFKTLEPTVIVPSLKTGNPQRIKSAKIQFTNTELFTGSSVILKIQPQHDDGPNAQFNLAIENVQLELVDR
ncbi:MAG: hypothetical protein WCT04_24250 [Planctomycetota bacterium]